MALIYSLLLLAIVHLASCREYDPDFDKMYDQWELARSVYDFTVRDANGTYVPMSKYKGYVLIITNVPVICQCSSKHVIELNVLEEMYHDLGLRVLAFPCDQLQFMLLNTIEEVNNPTKCDSVHKRFETMGIIDVNMKSAHPLYKYLEMKQPGLFINSITQDYTKFLIDRNGQPVYRWGPEILIQDMTKTVCHFLSLPANSPNKPSS